MTYNEQVEQLAMKMAAEKILLFYNLIDEDQVAYIETYKPLAVIAIDFAREMLISEYEDNAIEFISPTLEQHLITLGLSPDKTTQNDTTE